MLSRIRTLIIAALLGTLSAVAQKVTVEASLDSTAILIGQQLQLHTKVNCPKGAEVRFPKFSAGTVTEGIEMLEASDVDTLLSDDGKRWTLSRDYTITSFDSAVYMIPRVEVEVQGKKYTSPREIKLSVGTPDVDMQHPDEIRPFKAPVDGQFEWSPALLVWSLMVWLCVAIFIFCAVRLAKSGPVKRLVKVIPPTPPQKTAISAIERLRDEDREGEHLKEYYMQLTDVLRTYIVERFGFNAREMTTYEIVDNLRRHGDAAAIDELHSVLSTADLVKFAKYEATLAESDRALLQAVDYVRTTQIDDPAANEAMVKLVEVVDKKQRALKITYKVLMGISFFAGIAITIYVLYQLWLNFG